MLLGIEENLGAGLSLIARSIGEVWCRSPGGEPLVILLRLGDQAPQRLGGHVRDGLLADLGMIQPGQAQGDHCADPYLGGEHRTLIGLRNSQKREYKALIALEAGGQGGRDLRVLVEASGVQGPEAVRPGSHVAREGGDRCLQRRLDLLLHQAVKVKDLALHDGSCEGDLRGKVVVEERARHSCTLDDLTDVSTVKGPLGEQLDPDSYQLLPTLLGLESAARIGGIRGAHADETTTGRST